MTSPVLFIGRFPAPAHGPEADAAATFDSSSHAYTIASALRDAHAVFIEDPLSFPWDTIDEHPDAPIRVNISSCSNDDLVALGPVLRRLSRFDTLTINTEPEQRLFARALGIDATTVDNTDATFDSGDLSLRRERKQVDRLESALIDRWSSEFDTTVVDVAALARDDWTAQTNQGTGGKPRAVVVRVPGSTLTAQRSGFDGFARRLVTQVAGTHVIDLASIHPQPGAAVAHGLVVVGLEP